MHLAQHRCFGYAYLSTPGIWRYVNARGEEATVRSSGQLRVNNGEALLPAVNGDRAAEFVEGSESIMTCPFQLSV